MSAQVHAIERLVDFKAALQIFADKAKDAMSGNAMEIRRSQGWVESQLAQWLTEVRRGEELVEELGRPGEVPVDEAIAGEIVPVLPPLVLGRGYRRGWSLGVRGRGRRVHRGRGYGHGRGRLLGAGATDNQRSEEEWGKGKGSAIRIQGSSVVGSAGARAKASSAFPMLAGAAGRLSP